MTDTILSSLQIQKLGHNIKEIRERALHNVLSKLEFNPIHEKDMGRIKEILEKLFGWFDLKPLSQENTVLQLIKRILQSQHGFNIINFYTPKMLVHELVNIGKVVSDSSHSILDDIVNVIDSNRTDEIPRLVSEFPLSTRTNQGDYLTSDISTTKTNNDADDFIDLNLRLESDRTDITTPKSANLPCRYGILPWQPLVGSDCHVLQSVEESLRNPSQATTLIHSCEFFQEVLVQDFPAEVFLQRPAIVLLFQHLLSTCLSSRITTAVLVCLHRLTSCLKARINFFSDPNTHNSKLKVLFSPSLESGDHSNVSTINYPPVELSFLKSKQMQTPQYCLSTIYCVLNYLHNKPSSLTNINDLPTRKLCQVGINTSLLLLPKLVCILKLCFTSEFWQHCSVNSQENDILPLFRECLIKYADILDHFRLDITSNQNKTQRLTYTQLIFNLLLLIDILPSEELIKNIPRCLTAVLSAIILDAPISRLQPKMHQSVLEIVKKFDGKYEIDCCNKYEATKDIFASMSGGIKFLKRTDLSVYEAVNLAKVGLISLQFHKDLSFIRKFFDMCSTKLSINSFAEEDLFKSIDCVTESLLQHTDQEIQVESYKICRNVTIDTIGIRFSSNREPGSQILFLLRPVVLKQIITHGLSSENALIAECSNDILIHILKSKILVSSIIWQKTIEVLIPNLYLLLCYTSNKNSLSSTLINMLDPDKANKLHIPTEQVLKGNCCLLFSDNALIRAEAVSRLCWILSVDPKSSKLLPKLSNLHDKSLGLICQIGRRHDLNQARNNQHFYQPSSLHQVMDLLTSTAIIEPVIRRSALIQISVMMEDPLLHVAFQQRGGISVLITSLRDALTETNYAEYPDSVVPIFATLKNLCVFSAVVREQLSCTLEVFNFIIRGLVLFSTDDRSKQDGSTLLFLLLFHNVLKGSCNNHDLSIPQLVSDKLNTPFTCKTYLTHSLLTTSTPSIAGDKWCLSALRIHWNSEWFGGMDQIINSDQIAYDNVSFSSLLKLSDVDLLSLRYGSLQFCIQDNLARISSGSTHENVADAVDLLTNCVNLYNVVKCDYINVDITHFPWRDCFIKFIDSKPAGNEDAWLLTKVLRFLSLLTSIYKKSDDYNWISAIFKSKVLIICDILDPELSIGVQSKKLPQSLLKLITQSSRNSTHHTTITKTTDNDNMPVFTHLIAQIVDYLNFNNTQHFYNLAYLHDLLTCLGQLTMDSGWSNKSAHNKSIPNKPLLSKLINSLRELFQAFHADKRSSHCLSLMGLSITRSTLVIFNHILAEVQQYNTKDWEDLFLSTNLTDANILADFAGLLMNRDVILRAGVIQLFTGFTLTLKLTIKFTQNFCYNQLSVWDTFLAIILDHEEASIVRENATALLTNILFHSIANQNDLDTNSKLLPTKLLHFLTKYNIYKQIEVMLSNLNTETHLYNDTPKINHHLINKNDQFNNLTSKQSTNSSINSSIITNNSPTTAGLIKNIARFINQLLLVSGKEVGNLIHQHDLVRLLFRCVIVPKHEMSDRSDLANYCEVVFMNTAIVSVLSTAVNASEVCGQAVLHARGSLSLVVSLLNSQLFCGECQLLYLRNELWLNIYNLLTNLLQLVNSESAKVIISIINDCGFTIFIQTLYESIDNHNSPMLQHSALALLVSLLRSATISDVSMQHLFDNTSLSRIDVVLPCENQLLSPIVVNPANKIDKKTIQLTLLEDIYFGNIHTPKAIARSNSRDQTGLKTGGELCQLLIRLYELHKIQNATSLKLKYSLLSALTGVVCVSLEAKQYAFKNNLMFVAVQQLKDIYMKLSLENVSSLRKKRRLHATYKEMDAIVGLITNFTIGRADIKSQASILGLADLTHKLWTWFCTDRGLIISVLKMLCTVSTNCADACQSLTSTSAIAGLGPRKQPNFACLLNVIVNQIGKEMDLISRTHDFAILHLCFHLLQNCCKVSECRNVIAKSNVLQFMCRLHPAITKRQKSYHSVEFIWLNFLLVFTEYADGQLSVTKTPDVFEILLTLTNSQNAENKLTATMILRNVVFYAPNRPRLFNDDDFMNVLGLKLTTGSLDEQMIVATIMWSLAANNQKAKLIFKVTQLDMKLHEAIRLLQINRDGAATAEQLMQLHNVLNLIRAGEK